MRREASSGSPDGSDRNQKRPCQGLYGFDGMQKKSGASFDAPLHFRLDQPDQTQVITPLVMSHVFADCECVAVALHEGGGPATLVTTTVTFCDGLKP